MTERVLGIKKSSFPASTTVPDTATFDYVYNNTNTKITKANLLTALGVTGTIVQIGNPLSTQVLDTTGTVNGIRAITDGSGISTSVNAMNGIDIAHNFTQDSIGLPILLDIGAASPTFTSLLPGAGINLSADGTNITITATGTALPATNVVTVNVEADFPTAVGGVITLEAGKTYLLSNNVTTANRFVMSEGTSMIGYTAGGTALTYTGSATMFTSVDVNATFSNIVLNCPSAKVWDASETVGSLKTLSIRSVVVASCDTLGTITDLRTFFCEALSALSVATNGFNFVGGDFVLIGMELASIQSPSASFVALDLGTAVADTIRIRTVIFDGVTGGLALTGAASNGNLTSEGQGEMVDCSFRNDITPIDTIDLLHDVRWVGLDNNGLANTHPDSLSYNTAGTVVTIGSTSVPVKIGGTWVDSGSAHFTVDLAGRVTYIGVEDLTVPVTASLTCDPVSGGNKEFAVSFGVNGSVITATTTKGRAANADIYTLTLVWQIEFKTNDYVEAFIQNDSDTTNFNVSHGILRIN